MSTRSFKDLLVDELDDLIQQKRNGSLVKSKRMMRSSSKDSLFKDSLPFINLPNFNISKPNDKNPPAYSSSLQQALKEMQKTNFDLENQIIEFKEDIGRFIRAKEPRNRILQSTNPNQGGGSQK